MICFDEILNCKLFPSKQNHLENKQSTITSTIKIWLDSRVRFAICCTNAIRHDDTIRFLYIRCVNNTIPFIISLPAGPDYQIHIWIAHKKWTSNARRVLWYIWVLNIAVAQRFWSRIRRQQVVPFQHYAQYVWVFVCVRKIVLNFAIVLDDVDDIVTEYAQIYIVDIIIYILI